jgi:hypothetical protein
MLELNVAAPEEKEYLVTFKPLTYSDRVTVLKEFKEQQGYSFNELCAAKALLSGDRQDIPDHVKGVARLDYIDESNHRYVQFYIAVFMQLYTISEDELARSVEEAKRLMGKPVELEKSAPNTKTSTKNS